MTQSSIKRHWRIPDWFKGLSEVQLENLSLYHKELIRFNQHINLISSNTEVSADVTHFSDCLIAANLIFKEGLGKKVYDLGSGNGFPGLILSILDPKRTLILIDKDSRKVEFLRYMAKTLKLENTKVFQTQIENLQGEKIEFAISRAMASVSKSLLMTRKLFPQNGVYYQMKSNTWISEVSVMPPQLCSHWAPRLVGEYNLPVTNVERSVLKCVKLTD